MADLQNYTGIRMSMRLGGQVCRGSRVTNAHLDTDCRFEADEGSSEEVQTYSQRSCSRMTPIVSTKPRLPREGSYENIGTGRPRIISGAERARFANF
jgi:hypothetical protein